MADKSRTLKQVAKREVAWFLALYMCGLVLLPILIFVVGQQIFGSYAGAGFRGFFGDLASKLVAGQFYAWLLVLSPYIAWQTLRLMLLGWRLTAAPARQRTAAAGKP